MTTRGLLAAMVVLTLVAPPLSADSSIRVNPGNGHCYQRIDTSLTWHDARDACISLAAHLVSLHDSTENQFVFVNFVNTGTWSWLGGTDEDVEGTWTWASGESWSFEAWNPGEPNNLGGIEHYLVYFDTATIGWNDVVDMELPYVCEWSDPSCAAIFSDDFESGDTSAWSSSVP